MEKEFTLGHITNMDVIGGPPLICGKEWNNSSLEKHPTAEPRIKPEDFGQQIRYYP